MEIICTDFGSKLLNPDLIYLNLLLVIISGNFSWEWWGKSQSTFQSFNSFWFSFIWCIASCVVADGYDGALVLSLWKLWFVYIFTFPVISFVTFLGKDEINHSLTFKDIMHFDSLLYLLLLYVVAAVWFRVRVN